MEGLLGEHRERESNLRNTLLTAQRLADEIKDAAQSEAKMIVREAEGRADLLLQKAQGRLEEVERDINELRLRRRGVEGSLEASIQALYHALEFIRDQDRADDRGGDKVLLHRPRQTDAPEQAPSWLVDRTRRERRLVKTAADDAMLRVRVVPRAGRTEAGGWSGRSPDRPAGGRAG